MAVDDRPGRNGQPPTGTPTIRDIARLAGVSTATVSRTLMRPGMVAEETRAQVLRAVAEAGYTPNLLARGLRRHEAGAILVLVRDIVNPFYPEIFRGVERTARRLGFNVLMGNTDDDPAQERDYLRLALSRRADGMIVLTGRIPDLDDPAVRRVPIVLASEPVPGHELPMVRIDNRAAAGEITRHLIGLGHRRIAHVAGPQDQAIARDRLEGWRTALRDAGLPAGDDLVAPGDFRVPSGAAAGRALLALPEPPTAIFVASDEAAMGVLSAIHAAGLRAPQDVSVAGFDDIPFAEAFDPPLTTVRQPRLAMGEQAMTMLHLLIVGGAPAERVVTLPTELIIRGSTGPYRPG
ncbi:LacI family DNA-binding transcriptional regulator [Inquilinus sp.]|uniref:LacI family DNA-binding transcriptional regulator n=1 Tax=Inquilinus sp. TaxID=1932117 RepID=UPI003783E46A